MCVYTCVSARAHMCEDLRVARRPSLISDLYETVSAPAPAVSASMLAPAFVSSVWRLPIGHPPTWFLQHFSENQAPGLMHVQQAL